MKTTVKQLATGTFLALLLMLGNVKAEGTEIKNTTGKIIESSLQLEKWMTDPTIWNTNSEMNTELVQATEKKSELENWMTSEEFWNSNFRIGEETETALKLETWMINDAIWDANNLKNDPESTIEPWMIHENYWK